MAVKKYDDKRWQVRWRDANGAQRAKIFGRKTDADAYWRSVMGVVDRGEGLVSDSERITVAELGARWLDASLRLAAGSVSTYQRDLTRYINPQFGDMQVRRLTSEIVQRWLSEELERLAPSSVHRHYRTLRTMLGWAAKQRLVAANVCDQVQPPRIPHKEMEFLSVEQVEAIADAILPRYRMMVLVAAYSGLRWSELVGLRRRDILGETIVITGQLLKQNGRWIREIPKTAAGRRSVTLPASIAADLAAHLDTYSQPGPDGLVFVNQQKNPVGHSFRHNVWLPACEKVGLARRTGPRSIVDAPTWHSLRHTHVAICVAAGLHPKQIQHRLGHSSISVTLDRYGHLMAGLDDAAALQIDALRPI
jgi:integrase